MEYMIAEIGKELQPNAKLDADAEIVMHSDKQENEDWHRGDDASVTHHFKLERRNSIEGEYSKVTKNAEQEGSSKKKDKKRFCKCFSKCFGKGGVKED